MATTKKTTKSKSTKPPFDPATHTPKSKWFSDGVPATDPDKPPAKIVPRRPSMSVKDIKEQRIEQIAGLMRQMATKQGKPLWDRKIRQSLGKSWNLSDVEVRKLSAEASKRVAADVTNSEEITNFVGAAFADAMAFTFAKKDWRNMVALMGVGLKLAQTPVKVEIEVQAKQPTPADAAEAVRKAFGDKIQAPLIDVELLPESDDGPAAGPAED